MYAETAPFWRSQFDLAETVPDHAAWLDRHEALSAAADRHGAAKLVVADDAARWSLYRTATGRASHALVFIPGNLWCGERASSFTFVAETAVAANATLYHFDYPAMPGASMAEIVAATVAMLATVQAQSRHVVLVGHCSGGHLAVEAAMRSAAPPAAVVAISGLFELDPLRYAPVGATLALSAADAAAYSPVARGADLGVPLHLVVGADETAEYRRQSARMFEAVRNAGREASLVAVPRRHHDSVVADLADPTSELSRRVQALLA